MDESIVDEPMDELFAIWTTKIVDDLDEDEDEPQTLEFTTKKIGEDAAIRTTAR